MQTPPSARTMIDGKEYLYFSGTGYLGLHGHPRVIDAAVLAMQQFGLGSGTARSGYGTTPPHAEVERQAARFFGTEDAFYFPTGYLGSSVLIKSLAETFDVIFHDEAVHYSSRDAAALAGKPVVTFRTRDPEHLADILHSQISDGVQPLVMVDGVFPVRGAISPIAEYVELLRDYPNSALVVDDAHALGVLGPRGRGSYEHVGIDLSEVNTGEPSSRGPRLFVCGTMSKAFGGYGGLIFGTKAFVAHAKKVSSYFNGASALPPAVAAATAESLRMVREDPGILEQLRKNVTQARDGFRQLGLEVQPTEVPVICLEIGTATEMRRIQESLLEREILIAYQPAYSDLGPEGALRVAVFANHTPEMIDRLIKELRDVL